MPDIHRYARWDDTQQVFEMDDEKLMEELTEDLMAHGDVGRALRDLLQRGVSSQEGDNLEGLRKLMERVRQRRQENLQRYNVDSVFDDIKERLEQVVKTEKEGIKRRLGEAHEKVAQSPEVDQEQMQQLMEMLKQRAYKSKESLDNLPESPGGAIKELSEYEFMDTEAERQFQELLNMLKQQMLQNTFQNMKQQMQSMMPEDMARVQQMLKELNEMLHNQMMGRQPNFQEFMDKFGSMFGDNPPQNLEELMEQIARQIAQMQSLMESMSPEMRRELEGLMDSLLDPETMDELSELAMAMEQLFPMDQMRGQYPLMGEESMTMNQAMELMGQLQGLDELERQVQDVAQTGNVDDLDTDKIGELLGEEARRAAEALKRVTEMLEQAGYIKKHGSKLQLTPKGMRKIGQKALREVFDHLKRDRTGEHGIHMRGTAGEDTGETKLYEFGDPFDVDLRRSLTNAITRGGPQVPIKLMPQDFEVHRLEEVSQASTCLLLDQSRSMGMFGSFLAAKKVAMALYTLIHTQFPRDKLYFIGFSDYAIELNGEELPEATWNAWVSGTNMHHAFMLSRKLLSRQKVGTRQIIVITDGEPTAHIDGSQVYFAYPPSFQTMQETLKEVKRCTQDGIVINTFMLESSYHLLDFVDKMTRINKGRAFYTTPEKLGEFVLVDYLSNRRKRVG